MRVLMIGDIVGKDGQETLQYYLPKLKTKYMPDAIVVNGENAAPNGRGINTSITRKFLETGVDCITLGNHAWAQKDIFDFIDQEKSIIRPANYPAGTPGKGYCVIQTRKGNLTVINLLGRIFMPPMECPFRTMDQILGTIPSSCVLVDFHGEATSEKLAFAWHVDGKASAVIGTHTHVQTADERILPGGTGYLTDVGMVGPRDGIIGMDKEGVIKKFITQLPVRFEVAKGKTHLHGVVIDFDPTTKKTLSIKRIQIHDDNPFFD